MRTCEKGTISLTCPAGRNGKEPRGGSVAHVVIARRIAAVQQLELTYPLLLPVRVAIPRNAVTIVAQCPHCETRFNLQDDLVGKSMRCPNLECRQTFVVKSTGKPVEPPEPLPLPDEPEPARPTKPRSSQKPGGGDPRKPRQEVVEAEVVEAAIVAPPNVKEVVWSEGRDVPPPRGKGKKPSRATESDDDDDLPIIRRKKKKNRRPWILIGMSVTVLALLVFGGVSVLRHQTKAEETLAKQAKDAYAGGEYNSAQKLYRQLAEEYPKSDNVPEYDFFASLAVLQLDIRTATGGDPDKLVQQFRSFVAKYKDSPFAKPSTGRGGDIHDAGKKLAKDIVSFADGRVQKYREDRRKNEGELANAQKSLATGRELLPMLDPFRGPDEPPLDDLRQGLDGVEKQVQREHARSEALASAAKQLQEPTDETIQSVEADLAAADFLDDEAQAIIARAKEVLRAMVKFEAQEEAPKAIPASKTATLLFMTPVGPTRRPPATAAGEASPPSVFLAIARGILYAVDEDTGTLKWAARVGADENDPPTVTRADLATGPSELALVASDVGGEPALAAYELGTGAAKWYQPLSAPAAGPAVVVGGRAYIAVRDREGSIFEFDITTGVRKGRIRIAQPIGPGLVLRPGTGLIYAAADARRVFVIDAGATDDGGAPSPPRCVQVLVTMHPPGALRTPPVLLGPEGESDAKRLMILAQADGKRRAFELGAIQRPPAGVDVPPETIVNPQQELPIDVWVWFSPATDGERLALVTDRAEFRVFGVNQPGNHDRAIFPLPAPSLPSPVAGTAVRGLAIP
ncbi:MAG TPA: PQQ-binding-like beta-propeller repeat protein, partial [Gemmata sp.]|nr:PQQ-binding-like beta-propeller repeat protein [Gemmata sp.]